MSDKCNHILCRSYLVITEKDGGILYKGMELVEANDHRYDIITGTINLFIPGEKEVFPYCPRCGVSLPPLVFNVWAKDKPDA